jgi:hypothetical protein
MICEEMNFNFEVFHRWEARGIVVIEALGYKPGG